MDDEEDDFIITVKRPVVQQPIKINNTTIDIPPNNTTNNNVIKPFIPFWRKNKSKKKSNNNNNKQLNKNNDNQQGNGEGVEEEEEEEEEEYLPPIDWIPDELLTRIYSYLEPRDLGYAATVCQRFKQISYDASLWRDVLRSWEYNLMNDTKIKRNNNGIENGGDFDDDFGDRVIKKRSIFNNNNNSSSSSLTSNIKQIHARKYYVERYKTAITFHNYQKEQSRKLNMAGKYQRDVQRISERMKTAFFSSPHELLCIVCTMILTVLITLRVDGSVHWDWPIIFLPLLPIIYQCIVTPIIYDYYRTKHDYDYYKELGNRNNHHHRPWLIRWVFFQTLRKGRMINRVFVYSIVLISLLFFGLLITKLEVPDVFGWGAVFTPLLALCVISIALTIRFPSPISTYYGLYDRSIAIISTTLIFIFLVLLFKNLEGDLTTSWFIIFSPLFIADGVVLLYLLTLAIVNCSDRRMMLEGRTRLGGIRSTIIFLPIILNTLICQILLCLRLDGYLHSNFSLIFIPVYIEIFILLFGCCLLNVTNIRV